MLRLALHARPLRMPMTGVGQYIRGLARALQGRRDVDLACFYGLTWSRDIAEPPRPAPGASAPVGRATPLPLISSLGHLARRALFEGGMRLFQRQLYHEPNYIALPWDGPLVVTLHDLSIIHYAETHPAARRAFFDKHLAESLARATHIITDSGAVRTEAIRHFSLEPAKVTAIHLGADPAFRAGAAADRAGVLARHKLAAGQYVLSVGTLEPRKNLALALRAWEQLPEATRGGRILAIAGIKGWLNEELLRTVERVERAGLVRFLGYVPEADLPALYAGAIALVYPSRYEGFGLPVVEAMACGTPVITSTASCLPEVAGGAALLVDPDDVDGLCNALRELIEDPTRRAALAAAGLERAKAFTWERCAEETVGVYHRALR